MKFEGFKSLIMSNPRDFPVWARQLEWPEGRWHQCLPQPCIEISQEESMLLGSLGFEVEQEAYYETCWLPDSPRSKSGWSEPQWSCNIRVYYSYALVEASQYVSRDSLQKDRQIGKGTYIKRDQYGGYVVRFFKLGCDHTFRDIPEESYMCYHARVCTKCGMRNDIDSSD